MYKVCPKCGHERQSQESAPSADACPQCGLIYSKWLHQRFSAPEAPAAGVPHNERMLVRLKAQLLQVEESVDPLAFYGRLGAYVLFFVWGWYFILLGVDPDALMASFMHNINLVFHEAGHLIFRPFGWFMMVLGGSLAQLLMPAIVTGSLLWRADNFGASIGLWWLAQSMMDLAPYIDDARSLTLPLLGGGTGQDRPGMHDWQNILGHLGWLQRDHAIAHGVYGTAVVLMLVAFVWGGVLLWTQRRGLR